MQFLRFLRYFPLISRKSVWKQWNWSAFVLWIFTLNKIIGWNAGKNEGNCDESLSTWNSVSKFSLTFPWRILSWLPKHAQNFNVFIWKPKKIMTCPYNLVFYSFYMLCTISSLRTKASSEVRLMQNTIHALHNVNKTTYIQLWGAFIELFY